MDLHYSQTLGECACFFVPFHYLMDLHYSQTRVIVDPSAACFTTLWIYTILKLRRQAGGNAAEFHYLMDLHYSQTHNAIMRRISRFHYLMDLHYSQTVPRALVALVVFHYLMDLHYSQTQHEPQRRSAGFTTLWIYTILKPQISCAHYTAQGKSTRSSTIVLWRNGIVKGAQIPIQHIEFGAHIYARRCLAL